MARNVRRLSFEDERPKPASDHELTRIERQRLFSKSPTTPDASHLQLLDADGDGADVIAGAARESPLPPLFTQTEPVRSNSFCRAVNGDDVTAVATVSQQQYPGTGTSTVDSEAVQLSVPGAQQQQQQLQQQYLQQSVPQHVDTHSTPPPPAYRQQHKQNLDHLYNNSGYASDSAVIRRCYDVTREQAQRHLTLTPQSDVYPMLSRSDNSGAAAPHAASPNVTTSRRGSLPKILLHSDSFTSSHTGDTPLCLFDDSADEEAFHSSSGGATGGDDGQRDQQPMLPRDPQQHLSGENDGSSERTGSVQHRGPPQSGRSPYNDDTPSPAYSYHNATSSTQQLHYDRMPQATSRQYNQTVQDPSRTEPDRLVSQEMLAYHADRRHGDVSDVMIDSSGHSNQQQRLRHGYHNVYHYDTDTGANSTDVQGRYDTDIERSTDTGYRHGSRLDMARPADDDKYFSDTFYETSKRSQRLVGGSRNDAAAAAATSTSPQRPAKASIIRYTSVSSRAGEIKVRDAPRHRDSPPATSSTAVQHGAVTSAQTSRAAAGLAYPSYYSRYKQVSEQDRCVCRSAVNVVCLCHRFVHICIYRCAMYFHLLFICLNIVDVGGKS